MYQIGDLIIYGSTGVCRVDSFTTPRETRALSGCPPTQQYYVLKPVYQTETIYTPVENTRVFMRPIISAEEAERLIDLIPSMEAEAYHADSLQELKVHYEAAANTHNCEDLIEMTMSIYAKKQFIEAQNRKFGQVDERYMKQAEEMLYGEFALALDIPKDEVAAYIAKRVDAVKPTVAAAD